MLLWQKAVGTKFYTLWQKTKNQKFFKKQKQGDATCWQSDATCHNITPDRKQKKQSQNTTPWKQISIKTKHTWGVRTMQLIVSPEMFFKCLIYNSLYIVNIFLSLISRGLCPLAPS